MGVQGSRARRAGMLAGAVWFRVVRAPLEVLHHLDAAVDFILPSPPLLPVRMARATLPHRSLPF